MQPGGERFIKYNIIFEKGQHHHLSSSWLSVLQTPESYHRARILVQSALLTHPPDHCLRASAARDAMTANQEKGDPVEIERLVEEPPSPTLPTVNPVVEASKPPGMVLPPWIYVV